MRKWLAKRFRYTRELQDTVRMNDKEIRAFELIKKSQASLIDELENAKNNFSKMTLSELEQILMACIRYQEILKRFSLADPVERKVLPILEKYGITWEKNTLVDTVLKEAQNYAKNSGRRS